MRLIKKAFFVFASAFAILIISGFLNLRPVGGPVGGPLGEPLGGTPGGQFGEPPGGLPDRQFDESRDSSPSGPFGENIVFANHAVNQKCNDITHVLPKTLTDPVDENNNSGQLNFNVPSQKYQACADNTEQTWTRPDHVGPLGNFAKGWVWNTNFGWISLYCESNNNLGVACGNTNYYTTHYLQSGKLFGWAWNDNIGWIGMGCENGSNLGYKCGLVNYGVKIAQVDGENGAKCRDPFDPNQTIAVKKGDMYGYAWSDSAGWINFCGSRVSVSPQITPKVRFENNAQVFANNTDGYNIVIELFDDQGNKIDKAGHAVTIQKLTWDNKLRADQVSFCNPADPDPAVPPGPACNYNGAFTPDENSFWWNPRARQFEAYLTAIAPTGPKDTLTLKSVTVSTDGIEQEITTEKSFAFDPAVKVTSFASVDAPPAQGQNNIYAQVKTSTEHKETIEFHPGINGVLDDPTKVYVVNQLHDCSDAFDFFFDDISNGTGIKDEDGNIADKADFSGGLAADDIDRDKKVCKSLAGKTMSDLDKGDQGKQGFYGEFGTTIDEFNKQGGTVSRLVYTDVQDPIKAGNVIDSDNAAGIQTRVEYPGPNGITVRYFGLTVQDSSLINQSADVKGNVRIDIEETGGLAAGRIAQSIGESAQSKRELFYRAVQKAVGLEQESVQWPITFSNQAVEKLNPTNEKSKLYSYVNNAINIEPCRIILGRDNDATDLNFSGNVTIVSEGCDIYFMQNVNITGSLGIIALEDLAMSGARKGGNVYVCTRITDLGGDKGGAVHLVADGSVFTFGANENQCGTIDDRVEKLGKRAGLPDFSKPDSSGAQVKPLREAGKHQLTFVGSLVSNNTYGGSLKSPPETGDGTAIKDPTMVDTAKFYDLNFFRYSHTQLTADKLTCWADDVKLSKKLVPIKLQEQNLKPGDQKICFDKNNPFQNGIVNVIYKASSNELPIFKSVVTR